MINKILISNRGEIACRVIKTARKLGIKTVAVYSEADKKALHAQMADEVYFIGPPEANQSYLSIDKIIEAVKATQSNAVHPGYGFLSENPTFVNRLEQENIIFIGPSAKSIELMGDKLESKKIASSAGVSTVPGHLGIVESSDDALSIAKEIGFPVMIKASAGGGGKGMRVATSEEEVVEGFISSQNEAASSFGDNRIIIEKFVESPRHIEIQVLADKFGNCIYLNERECSIQRRNQKVIEEAPSPFLDAKTRQAMGEQAVLLAKAVDYYSAGTVEFIVDKDKNFYFLEMNTRLQVEHPITELTTHVDLVEEMINVANEKKLTLTQDTIKINGWAIESRVYAEDPSRNFLPSTGRLTKYRPPAEINLNDEIIRNDTGVFEGGEISVFYDPMIAKLCSWGKDRNSAITTMRNALDCFQLEGIASNLQFLSAVYDHPRFVEGKTTTGFIEEEFPNGFEGTKLSLDIVRKIASCATYMHHSQRQRRASISHRMHTLPLSDHSQVMLLINKETHEVSYDHQENQFRVQFESNISHTVETNWKPNQRFGSFLLDGSEIHLKFEIIPYGFLFHYRGCSLEVLLKTQRQVELNSIMKEIVPPDTTKLLLCPMPGLVTEIMVSEGDHVEEGQSLCTIEAMKMENVLKAPKAAKIATVEVETGDTLEVDQTILKFE